MRDIMPCYMVCHAAERSNAGSCADQEKILLEILFMQNEDALCSAKRYFGANSGIIEQPGSAGAIFKQHDDEFKYIGAIGPARNRITPPSSIRFFVDRKVERNKLPGFEIETFQFGYLYPISPCVISFILYPYYFPGSPGLKGHLKIILRKYTENTNRKSKMENRK